ncbi:MAG: two component regulator three y domain-containing protein [Allomuricauda sp.]|nr:MAG: two component regulator three y domain-containing protein [Allomuricauda sp.]
MNTRYFVFFFLFTFLLQSQELPPIKNYLPQDYNGENQNWSITQGPDGHIYVANNHKLLEFDGVRWSGYASPNASIFRSVAANDSLIFTGQYMEFGFWKKNSFGSLEYTSISKGMNTQMIEDEEFWNIIVLEDWILFQSLDRIYSYNIATREFKVLEAKSTKAHLFKVGQTVYFQNQNLGVYKIQNGEPKLMVDHNLINDRNVVGMFGIDNKILMILDNANFLVLGDDGVQPWNNKVLDLPELNVYSTAQLTDGTFILGTIADGMYQIGTDGTILRRINQLNGLNNNTVLFAFQDRDKNLWLGLDNGLSVVNIESPFNEFRDNSGKLGLVYAAKVYEEHLYLGTNQGLFVKPLDNQTDFSIIEGTDGQVWSLTEIQGALFCGHNKGTFVVQNTNARLISDLPGTWVVKEINGHPELLLQGNYDGLSILRKQNGNWVLSNTIEGFSISSRFVEVINDREVLVNHEYKGIHQLTLRDDYSRVVKKESLPIMGYGSSMVRYNDQIVYTSLDGAFSKEKEDFSFIPDTTLLKLFFTTSGGVTSISIPDDASNRLWCFTYSGLSYVQPQTFSSSLQLNTIPIPSFFKGSLGVSGFENLTNIGDEKYIIGMSNGFVVLDLNKLRDASFSIRLNSAVNNKGLEAPVPMNLLSPQALEYEQNTLSFSYSVPQYNKYTEVSYQYRLLGLFDDWSPFTNESEVTFNNLKFGDYQFQVRAKAGNTLTSNTAQYDFTIDRPWYWSNLAILVYVLATCGLFFAIHRIYKGYYTKKQERVLDLEKRKQKRKKLKAEKELIKLRNDKLRAEVESKNRELAVATMSMIKKSEFLNSIKSDLNKVADDPKVKSVIRTIDRNLNSTDDWKFFEEAFNNADKDFLKKVKELHPEMTPNDLKLCAYLRLNLSSKEIAPLLNISVRSVEVKRYRLRKKMDLPHENSLTEYIISL